MRRAAQIESSGDRTARFVASNGTVDRYGDIIDPAGWQLDNFRKNPVLLYGHDGRSFPIGTVSKIGVTDGQLIADAAAAPAGIEPRADAAWGLIDAGVLRAVSVGFVPLADPVPIRDAEDHITGFRYSEQELAELSVVPVPANPEALRIAKSFGAETLFEEFVPRSGLTAARARLELTKLRA